MHWKDWCWSSNTLAMYAKNWIIGKNLDAGKDWGQEEKGNREWVGYSQLMDTDSMDISLSKLQEIVKDREARHTAVHRVAKNQTWLSYWTTTQASSLFTKYIKHYLHNKKGSFHKIRNFRQKIKYICIHICVCVYIYIYIITQKIIPVVIWYIIIPLSPSLSFSFTHTLNIFINICNLLFNC